MRLNKRDPALLFLLSAALWLPTLAKPQKMERMQPGRWGGDHISLNVESNAATVEYDCAHGIVNGPLEVDSSGRFNLTGTYIGEYSGPVRGDKPLTQSGARYTGWTDGRQMKLTVTILRTNKVVAAFLLERGREGRVNKCK